MKILKTLLMGILSTSLYAQKDTTLIENWQSYPIPVNKDTLLRYNHSSGIVVYQTNGKIKAKREVYKNADDLPFKIIPLSNNSELDQFSGTRKVLKVDDGYLIGYNRGEFGGSLFWFSADGKKYYLISNINLQQFIHRNNEIYAIQGLSHMGTNEGSIVKITNNKKWSAIDYLRLPYAPMAATLDKQNNFLIICSSALLKVDGSKKVSTLVTNENWLYYLYPNSILLDDERVYLGMRGGVICYNMISGKQKWLMPH